MKRTHQVGIVAALAAFATIAHYVTDVHATILHLLGLDPHQLEIPGRKRLERDFGNVIREVIA